MIPMTHPDLKIRVSLMVEILRLKITLGTLCAQETKSVKKIQAWGIFIYGYLEPLSLILQGFDSLLL